MPSLFISKKYDLSAGRQALGKFSHILPGCTKKSSQKEKAKAMF